MAAPADAPAVLPASLAAVAADARLVKHLASFVANRDLGALARTCHGLHEPVSAELYRRNVQPYKRHVLQWAVRHAVVGTARRAIAAGAQVNYRRRNFNTVLVQATLAGNDELVAAILAARGVRADLQGMYGRTALSIAAETGNVAIVRHLLSRGSVIRPDTADDMDRTPLHYAARLCHSTITRMLLLTDGVDPNARCKAGRTPLHYVADALACHRPDAAACASLLLHCGADPDSKDSTGRTPLHLAAESGKTEVVRLLLATRVVDPYCRDAHDGRSPRDLAVYAGHSEIVRMFLRYPDSHTMQQRRRRVPRLNGPTYFVHRSWQLMN